MTIADASLAVDVEVELAYMSCKTSKKHTYRQIGKAVAVARAAANE